MAVLLAVAVVLGVVALDQRNEAREQGEVAQAHALAALSDAQLAFDPELAILLARRSVSTHATPQGMLSLRRALDGSLLRATMNGHRDLVRGLAFSPSGKQLATASFDGTVRIWDVRDGRELHGSIGAGNAVTFTPDGRSLVVGRSTTDGCLRRRGRPLEAIAAADRPGRRRPLLTGRAHHDHRGQGVGEALGRAQLRARAHVRAAGDLIRAALSADGRTLAGGTDRAADLERSERPPAAVRPRRRGPRPSRSARTAAPSPTAARPGGSTCWTGPATANPHARTVPRRPRLKRGVQPRRRAAGGGTERRHRTPIGRRHGARDRALRRA